MNLKSFHEANMLLAIAGNIATNGRWFCASLIAINAHSGHTLLALLSALPIGLAVLTELFARGRVAPAIGLYAYTAAVAVLSLVNAW